MTSTNWLLLVFFILALCLCSAALTNPPTNPQIDSSYVDALRMYDNNYQTGGTYISNWWNPFSWGSPSYGIGYDGIYPSYDSTYIDGNSRGWYNAGGWYGQTARPYYGYGRGTGYGYGRGRGRW